MDISDIIDFDLEGMDCEEFKTPEEKCLSGQPLQRTWNLYSAPDERFFSGIWEAEPGRWRVNYTEFEYFRILSGRSILRDNQGGQRELGPGTEVILPAGFEGDWEVLEKTRKVYVIYEP